MATIKCLSVHRLRVVLTVFSDSLGLWNTCMLTENLVMLKGPLGGLFSYLIFSMIHDQTKSNGVSSFRTLDILHTSKESLVSDYL